MSEIIRHEVVVKEDDKQKETGFQRFKSKLNHATLALAVGATTATPAFALEGETGSGLDISVITSEMAGAKDNVATIAMVVLTILAVLFTVKMIRRSMN